MVNTALCFALGTGEAQAADGVFMDITDLFLVVQKQADGIHVVGDHTAAQSAALAFVGALGQVFVMLFDVHWPYLPQLKYFLFFQLPKNSRNASVGSMLWLLLE